jgi:hypothetical protein
MSLGVAALRFNLAFTFSPLLLPALFLVSLASVGIGYGIAYATKPEVAGVLSQLILFIALMFAPINYPAERLPRWLASTHDWLPFTYMAQVVRETINVPATGGHAAAVRGTRAVEPRRPRRHLPRHGPPGLTTDRPWVGHRTAAGSRFRALPAAESTWD